MCTGTLSGCVDVGAFRLRSRADAALLAPMNNHVALAAARHAPAVAFTV
jgi:hypothetical protein